MALVCTLASGSDGNATLVSHRGTHLLVDAGISARRIRLALERWGLTPADIDAVLVTHSHTDHICGLGVLRRPVFAAPYTAGDIRRRFAHLAVQELGDEQSLEIGTIGVTPFATPHDTEDSLGFLLHLGRQRACVCTDLGHVTAKVQRYASLADCLCFEANHDEQMLRRGPYPAMLKKRILGPRGHLSNLHSAEAIAGAVQGGASHVSLCHLSRENNEPGLAYRTVCEYLQGVGIRPGRDLALEVAPHGETGRVWGQL